MKIFRCVVQAAPLATMPTRQKARRVRYEMARARQQMLLPASGIGLTWMCSWCATCGHGAECQRGCAM